MILRGLVAALALGCSILTASAQVTSSIPDERASSLAELNRVTEQITLSGETVARLTADIATLRKDHATITAALRIIRVFGGVLRPHMGCLPRAKPSIRGRVEYLSPIIADVDP